MFVRLYIVLLKIQRSFKYNEFITNLVITIWLAVFIRHIDYILVAKSGEFIAEL